MWRKARHLFVVWAAWALVMGCHDDHGNYPGGNPGFPVDTSRGIDAAVDARPDGGDSLAAGRIRGQICRVEDPAKVGPCEPVQNSKLIVAIGALKTAKVDADGRFDIEVPTGAKEPVVSTNVDNDVYFGGATQVSLGSQGGAINVKIPVMRRSDLRILTETSNIAIQPGTGLLVVHVERNGAPVQGATLTDVQGLVPFYDTATPFLFTPSGVTGPRGTAIYFNLTPGTIAYSVSKDGKTSRFSSVAAQSALFVTTAVLPLSP
ncbi:MAG: hypothetical protein HY698_00930 [Deltaproteobacteria bacterium]|nr:hypothetical protein [Deltaproteobacteria bacterium]